MFPAAERFGLTSQLRREDFQLLQERVVEIKRMLAPFIKRLRGQ